MIVGTSVPWPLIKNQLAFYRKWDMRTLIDIKLELNMLADRCKHYSLFTIKSCHLNLRAIQVPALVPVSCVMIGADFLHDAMTLTKTVGYNAFVHWKCEDRSSS